MGLSVPRLRRCRRGALTQPGAPADLAGASISVSVSGTAACATPGRARSSLPSSASSLQRTLSRVVSCAGASGTPPRSTGYARRTAARGSGSGRPRGWCACPGRSRTRARRRSVSSTSCSLHRVGPQPVLVADVDRDARGSAAGCRRTDRRRRAARSPPTSRGRPGCGCAVLRRQVEVERRVLRVRRPRRGRRELRAREERQACAESAGVFIAASRLLELRVGRPGPRADEAARAHDVEAAEHVGVLHADAGGAVAAHRMADEPAAPPVRHRAVVGVDVRHDVVARRSARSRRSSPSSSTSSRCARSSSRAARRSSRCAPWAKAPSIVCGTWISPAHCSAPIE